MKNGISPLKTFVGLIIYSTLSLIYLANVLSFGSVGLEGWKLVSLILQVITIIINIVLIVIILKNKWSEGDEFTRKILFKAGYYSFVSILLMISLVFLYLQVLMVINANTSSLNDFIDLKLVLGLICIIQSIGSLIFFVLYFVFYKSGESLK